MVAISSFLVEGFTPYSPRKYSKEISVYISISYEIKLERTATYEPSPTSSLNSSSSSVKLLYEVLETAKGRDDSFFQGTVFQDTTSSLVDGRRRSKVLPEQGVVDVSYR